MNKTIIDRTALNHYKLKLTTLSPIHIGTGEIYEPMNYVVDNQTLYHFDEMKFFTDLPEIDKKQLQNSLTNYLKVIQFYRKHKDLAVKISHFNAKTSKEIQNRYNKTTNKDGTANKNQLEILKTYKNPNSFKPILPGSSIKGMFETALGIYANPESASNQTRQNVIVSDAVCIKGDVEIGIANRRHRNLEQESKSGIYQFIEVITPGSEFIFAFDANFGFEHLKDSMYRYHEQRKNSRFEGNSKCFVARLGKNVGKDYVVYDGTNVKNSYDRPLATHFLYSSDALTDEEFGWVKIEILVSREASQKTDPYSEKIDNLNTIKARIEKQIEGKGIKRVITVTKFSEQLKVPLSALEDIMKKLDIQTSANQQIAPESSISIIDKLLDQLSGSSTDKKGNNC